ncbi:MKRN2 opposite strand protein-like [Saccoglossus kowalevskii]|uniref:MKRN2 opposite strand protein n=1 Tax=Saccoglossus kowalevskii TaxID=10224 RepID=A0ABM0M0F6_SACKO|nr:PREDICTED: putative uncharacterized protein C3orf83-like [Saccoglossus kowalevskii]
MSSLGVLCFNHCSPVNIFCFEMPDNCPLCGTLLDVSPCQSPPFRIPSPFANGITKPYSVVVKPTEGTFLQHYERNSNLHVGITSSKGAVYNYDEYGLHKVKDKHSWKQSVIIPLLDNRYDDELMELWDECLQNYAVTNEWDPDKYNEETHNCYDFVIGFLNNVQYNELIGKDPPYLTRKQFCTEFIIPHTTKAARYIDLYRKVQQETFLVKEESYC